jgi:molybdopterin synthase catalytic subunit
MVSVQREPFDAGAEIERLRAGNPKIGAIACFVGIVRDVNDGAAVKALTLERYPAMTEKAMREIVEQAKTRWDIFDTTVIHRVSPLRPADPIVLVIAAAGHRRDAFAACEFIMDYLKSRAPFWKRGQTAAGERWVAARASDTQTVERWNEAIAATTGSSMADGNDFPRPTGTE